MKLTAVIDANDLASDNTRAYVVDVSDRLPVLILSGDEHAGRFRREADFLQLALTPFSTSTTRPADDNRNPCVGAWLMPNNGRHICLMASAWSYWRMLLLYRANRCDSSNNSPTLAAE